ncbi:DNA polymerase-3 subunit epsilon [Neobacillus niacini]|uniref:3'-5' exonuclease n=1 Tax=Neobacillus driksii TaxID=3035913 RepID=UPI00277EE073|nr:3'-5' exonuclease [Neobacillus niacini]MDQ0976631.1 DNA polymerase-3 subunit epsilon [Neobacillus niacini]
MYIVFDFETTGLDYKTEQVIEIAGAKLDENLNPIGTYNTMVALNEGRTLPQFIRQLTGISAEDLKDGKPEDVAMQELKEFIGDDIVIAQFASFDLSYLSKVLLPERFICTRSMARMLRPTEYASLKNLIKIYGIDNLDPHRAYADVEATIEVFKAQKKECDEQGIEYMNVLIDSNERPLSYVPDNAIVKYMEV